MPIRAPKFSIILAAGKGTRMRSADCHKVCFPVDGRAAVCRAIDIYNACGIRHHILVVGALAGQVMETVGAAFDNVSFAYQADQLGTAHAARVGVRALDSVAPTEDLLLVAGDRIIEPSALEQLFDLFYNNDCDLALLAVPRRERSTQGRIVTGAHGAPLAITEAADIRQRRVLRDLRARAAAGQAPTRDELIRALREGFAGPGAEPPTDKKLAAAFGRLWESLAASDFIPTPAGLLSLIPESLTRFDYIDEDGAPLTLDPDAVDAAPLVNTSVYLVRAAALQHALARLDRENAQREEYLSALVEILARARAEDGRPRFRTRALRVDQPNYVLGFNDPAELLEVEEALRSRRAAARDLAPSPWFRPIADWQADFAALAAQGRAGAPALWDDLVAHYSDDAPTLAGRIAACRAALDHAAAQFGPASPVLIVRSPGRVNVMGRHIDHQGGNCNLMTIGFETLMIVRPRPDDRIRLLNTDSARFGEREFSIADLVADLPWDDWLSLVNSDKVASMARTYGGDWSQYPKAAILRLQKKFAHTRLRGMDIIVSGNIPMAAGLSSSSSLVVGAAEATIAVSRLDTFPNQLVDLCGEGEWFVGTRGGAADHAAIKLSQKGRVIKVGFFDFAIQDVVPFPADCVMVVCDSGISARKTANARDQFNHRVSCYRLGLRLVRRQFPQYAPLLAHLRDLNVRNLRLPLAAIYRILLHLPESATRAELRELLPGEDLEPLFASHAEPADGLYPIRGVVLFGLAECERARLYADCLKAGRVDEIGRMMDVSHDGDRVARFGPDGAERPWRAPVTNSHLLALMEDLESGDPERVVRAQLQWQPGDYHCSLPAIDRMVDIARRVEGVHGAQLAGAGLGGCMMVLARRAAVPALVEALTRGYYAPAAAPPAILVCHSVAGSGILLRDSSQ